MRPCVRVQVKRKDDERVSLEAWCKQLLGTARAMGIQVVARPEDSPPQF